MDRLTGEFKGASMFATVEQARQYNRLRQYEDTGLTPDEIAALRAENERLRALVDKVYDIAVEEKFEEVEAAIDDARWRERQESARAALEGGQQ